MNAPGIKAVLGMTADTVGKDLLIALLQEIRLLPDVWVKRPKARQEDIISRLRDRVTTNIRMAVHVIASQGRTVVVGDLEQITIRNGTKAVIKIGRGAESLHELYDAQGKAVLIVVADAGDHTGGMDELKGEADQRGLDLGHEYHDNDGGGMDNAEGDDDEAIDGEALRLPAPGDITTTDEDLKKAFEDGYQAAADGKPERDCPIIAGELVIEWIRGHKAWHESLSKATPKTAKLGEIPNAHGVYICESDEVIQWSSRKGSAKIRLLELEDGRWLYAKTVTIGTTGISSGPLSLKHDVAESREAALRAVRSRLTDIYARGLYSGLSAAALKSFTAWVNGLLDNHGQDLAA